MYVDGAMRIIGAIRKADSRLLEMNMSDTFLNPVTTQTWANGRHIVRCVKVIQETWDVRTFCFMADQPLSLIHI